MTSTKMRALGIMIATWIALPLSYYLPEMDLSGGLSVFVTNWTHSGDVLAISLLSLGLMGFLVMRPGISWHRRLKQILVHVLVLVVLQGGGALVNEYLIKPSFATPRPNIVRLAELDVLEMTPELFYSSMDRRERRTYLKQVLANPSFDSIAMNTEVREHWIHETGYSMPSGHAFSTMLAATYFLTMGMALVTDWRRWIFYLLPGWAVSVAWSRVMLGVHRPVDVAMGGLLGIVLGVVAVWFATRRSLGILEGIG